MENALLHIRTGENNDIVFNLHVQSGAAKYAVYDFAGHVLLSGMLQGKEPYRIQVVSLVPGKYSLRIIDGDTCSEGKFEKAITR